MRTACWTCRSRTIQCDQSRTPCAKCEKAGLECFDKRPLRWVKGAAIRGKMRGQVLGGDTKTSDKRQRVSRPYTKSLVINITPSFALQDPRIHDLDWSSRFYLDYYNARIAKLFILYDSESNPFRALLTYAMDNPMLRKCIIAVAARHFANTGQSFDQTEHALCPRFVNANLDALRYKKQTIKTLSLSLSRLGTSQKDEILATILLLIFLNLLESGMEEWKYHSHGAEGFANISRSLLAAGVGENASSDTRDTADETRRFVAQQFLLVSTIGGALSDAKPSPGSCFDLDENKHQESIIRSFLGCPGFLLGAIRFLSNQRHMIKNLHLHDDVLIDEHVKNTLTMFELTRNFDCLEWALTFAHSIIPSTGDIQKLFSLSQAYKIATLLYGNRVLRALRASTGTIAFETTDFLSQLINVIDSLKCDAAFFKCLLWPSFIAGLECQCHNEQKLVTGFLKMLWKLTSCLNVITASKILHDHWRQKQHDGNLAMENSELHVIEQGWLLI